MPMFKDVPAVFVLVLFCMLLASCNADVTPTSAGAGQPIQLSLTTDRQTYHLGEPIALTLLLTNTGTDELLVNARMAHNRFDAPAPLRDVTLVITGPSGTRVTTDARIDVGLPVDGDFMSMDPGDSVERTYGELNRLYPIETLGAYSIQAIYQNWDDPSFGVAWKGEVGSNVATFTLEP
jgi:predicted small secreted protein